MSGADLELASVTGAIVTEDGVISPDGVVLFERGLPATVAAWRRASTLAIREQLQPLQRLADEWLYERMDRDGEYTLHLEGYDVTGESLGSWEGLEKIDAEQLYADLLVLRARAIPFPPLGSTAQDVLEWDREVRAWVDAHFKTERTVTAAGRSRLTRMSGAYATALATATSTPPAEERRARKAPTIKETAR